MVCIFVSVVYVASSLSDIMFFLFLFFFFQAEDGIRDLVRSRGLGDVYKRQDGEVGLDAWHGPIPESLCDVGPIRRPAGEEPVGDGGVHQPGRRWGLSLIHI